MKGIELTSEFKYTLNEIQRRRRSLYVTGSAGTGKSTLIKHFLATTDLETIVLAPTGVAAVEIGGQTIHSFFRFRWGLLDTGNLRPVRDPSSMRKMDVLVLDEASMISANLMDAIDVSLRINRGRMESPFGGVQVLLVGDLCQLRPVVKDDAREFFSGKYGGIYFFDAPVFKQQCMGYVELTKVFRQTDPRFAMLLNSIREGQPSSQVLAVLNARVCERGRLPCSDDYVTLTPNNNIAHQLNLRELERLGTPETEYKAVVTGEFNEAPTDESLRLKKGARVIMLNNDKDGRWVNGTLGTVRALSRNHVTVEINGSSLMVEPNSWEQVCYRYDKKKDTISQQVVGTFKQMPMRLAWALTIHKSQGQTIERVYLDLAGGAFAAGQTYVALSRCTSLEGLALSRPIFETDLIADVKALGYREALQPIIPSKDSGFDVSFEIPDPAHGELDSGSSTEQEVCEISTPGKACKHASNSGPVVREPVVVFEESGKKPDARASHSAYSQSEKSQGLTRKLGTGDSEGLSREDDLAPSSPRKRKWGIGIVLLLSLASLVTLWFLFGGGNGGDNEEPDPGGASQFELVQADDAWKHIGGSAVIIEIRIGSIWEYKGSCLISDRRIDQSEKPPKNFSLEIKDAICEDFDFSLGDTLRVGPMSVKTSLKGNAQIELRVWEIEEYLVVLE